MKTCMEVRLIMTNSSSKSKADCREGLLSIKAVFLSPNDPFTWAEVASELFTVIIDLHSHCT